MYKSPDACDIYIFKGYFGNDGTPHINVNVKLSQNSKPYNIRFRIDTGKNSSSLSPETAKILGIKDKERINQPIIFTFGQPSEPPKTIHCPKGFQITPIPQTTKEEAQIFIEHNMPNTLGTDILFKFFELTLNRTTIKLMWLNELNTEPTRQKFTPIAVKIPEFEIDKELMFGIDTGSPTSSLSHKDAKALGIYQHSQDNPEGKYIGFKGEVSTKILKTPVELFFTKHVNRPQRVMFKDGIIITENDDFPTLIGTDVLLSCFNLRINKSIVELTVLKQ